MSFGLRVFHHHAVDALHHWIVLIEIISAFEEIGCFSALQQFLNPAKAIGALGKQIDIEGIHFGEITTRGALFNSLDAVERRRGGIPIKETVP